MIWGRSIFLRFGVPILKLLRLGLYSSNTEFSKNKGILRNNLAISCSEKKAEDRKIHIGNRQWHNIILKSEYVESRKQNVDCAICYEMYHKT